MKKNNQEVVDLVVDSLLNKVNSRSAEILKARFGLEKEEKKSLSMIGKKLGITRERVRQLESNALKKIKKSKKNQEFGLIMENVLEIIDKYEGLVLEDVLAEAVFPGISQIDENKLMFVLSCDSKLVYNRSTLKNKSFWSLKNGLKKEKINKVNKLIFDYLNKNKKSIKIKEALKVILESEFKNDFIEKNAKDKLKMFLLISKDLKRNLLNEWGIKNWRSVSERGNKEKAYLVLRKKNKPLHFRVITEHINLYWKKKKSLPQTVHNELIKDDRFVLVGRGTYGLSEWGLKGGTVKEIIVNLFKEKPNPLHVDEIVEHVFSHKEVKRTTVLVNLSNQKYFVKKDKGQYFIK
jgi:DNA-directed RNA polymerase delta subunit/predicted RNA-binding protein